MHIFIFIYTYIYTDICIYLLRGNIAVKRRNASDTLDIALDAITQVAFKNCAPFEKCSTEIDVTLVDPANFMWF